MNTKELKELNDFLKQELSNTTYGKSENDMFIIQDGVLKQIEE